MERDYSSKIKQMRNLAMFKDKTDEEILDWIKKREERQRNEEPEKPVRQPIKKTKEVQTEESADAEYQALFDGKLEQLKTEYGVDMNNSNDAEMLKSLVEQSIQKDVVNKQIIRLQREEELDTRTLKNLGDYQKGLIATITDLQEKLGINRKQRKEKQVDSIPQFVEIVRSRARDVWQRSTVPVRCEACEIELARYWLNFPDKASIVQFELECWQCGERVVFAR
jgi:hypothetical protein